MEEKDDSIRVLKSGLSLPLIRGVLTLVFSLSVLFLLSVALFVYFVVYFVTFFSLTHVIGLIVSYCFLFNPSLCCLNLVGISISLCQAIAFSTSSCSSVFLRFTPCFRFSAFFGLTSLIVLQVF